MALKVVNEVNMCLTKEINALLKNCLTTSSLPVLGQLLLCDNMEDVEKTWQIMEFITVATRRKDMVAYQNLDVVYLKNGMTALI